MRLTCISAYRTQSVAYVKGQAVDVNNEEGERLLRDSPGSFRKGDPDHTADVRKNAPDEPDAGADDTEAKTAAISAETETGITAPDRRSRGGRKRGRK